MLAMNHIKRNTALKRSPLKYAVYPAVVRKGPPQYFTSNSESCLSSEVRPYIFEILPK